MMQNDRESIQNLNYIRVRSSNLERGVGIHRVYWSTTSKKVYYYLEQLVYITLYYKVYSKNL